MSINKAWPSLLFTASALSLLGACAIPESPAQVCASTKTSEAVRNLLDRSALEQHDGALLVHSDGKSVTPDELTAALQSLWESNVVKLELVTLKSADRDTHLISCEAQLRITLSPQQKDAGSLSFGTQAFHAGNSADLSIHFTRQPTADGKDQVYSVDRNTEVEQTLLAAAALQTFAQHKRPAVAVATPPNDEDSSRDKLLAETPDGHPTPPLFEAYKADPMTGSPNAPDFAGPQASYAPYRTRYLEAFKAGPNFAGHLTVVSFGCGTGCTSNGVIDNLTGAIIDIPFGGEDYGELNLDYRRDSNLINATWQVSDASFDKRYCLHQSLVWTGREFKQLNRTKSAGDCDAA